VVKYINWQKKARIEGIKETAFKDLPELCMPVSINLDLATACNFRCGHCIDNDILNNKIKHNHKKLITSLRHMINHGLKSVILIGGGEPTLYPKFSSIVNFLKENDLQVAISSNGSRNDIIYNVVDRLCGNDWVRLSIDAGLNDTFLHMHKPLNGATIDSICRWVPKMRNRNPKLSIGFSFVIVWDGAKDENGLPLFSNINEIVDATKLARNYGFSYISLKPFLMRYTGGSEVMDPSAIAGFESTVSFIRSAVMEAKTYETESFKVIESTNLSVLKDGNWHEFTRQPSVCHMQAFRQILSPLGLFNCPAFRGVKKSYMGDKNAFYGQQNTDKTRRSIANSLACFDASSECAKVTCLYNQVNWWIEKAIQGKIDPSKLKSSEERHDYFL